MAEARSPDLAALYLRYRDSMYRVAASVLRGAGLMEDTGDVVNDAMMSILRNPPKNVKNWEALLVTVVKRKALDKAKSAHVKHHGPPLDLRVHDVPQTIDIADDIEKLERAEEVRELLSRLEHRYRYVLWEVVALKRPRAEVAKELGVTPARVSQMKTQALRMLRELMTEEEVYFGRQDV